MMLNCGPVTAIAKDIWTVYNDLAEEADRASALGELATFWNEKAGRSWGQVSLRPIRPNDVQIDSLNEGGKRTFMAVSPLGSNTIRLSVKKQGGSARAAVSVCKIDQNGKVTYLWDFNFASGQDNIGRELSRTLTGLRDHLLSVYVDTQGVGRAFDYTLEVVPQG